MNNIPRILVVFLLLLGGISLTPLLVAQSARDFHWRTYAEAYQSPKLTINHSSGAPGSYFEITGSGFTAYSTLNIAINNFQLGTIDADDQGVVNFALSTSEADPGLYIAVLSHGVTSVKTRFDLLYSAPLWSYNVGLPLWNVPSSIALKVVYLPTIRK